jgi:hypothetical protein
MIRFLLGKPGIRWQFELRAIPVKRAEPDTSGGMYESMRAEVGAYDHDDANGAYDAAGAGWDAGRAW